MRNQVVAQPKARATTQQPNYLAYRRLESAYLSANRERPTWEKGNEKLLRNFSLLLGKWALQNINLCNLQFTKLGSQKSSFIKRRNLVLKA